MSSEGQHRTIVEALGEREIKVERIFDAPRETVFAVSIDPQQVPEWWGPHGTRATIDRLEARAGGEWRFVSRSADGRQDAFRGAFREIVPPERIVQTFEWEGMPGYVSVETATFEPLADGRTRLTAISTFFFREDRDGMLASGMEDGLRETYERLDALLARVAART